VLDIMEVYPVVGVGFSYTTDGNYGANDNSTATDNYWLVQKFLDRFPHLRSNDFYLTSESYGGR
jgi:carboxypeptidase C (cathepsin A)